MLKERSGCESPYKNSKGRLRLLRQEACPSRDQFLFELCIRRFCSLSERHSNTGEALYEPLIEVHKAQKGLHFVNAFWLRPVDNAGYTIISISTPVSVITYPKKGTDFTLNRHLESFVNNPAVSRASKTVRTCCSCWLSSLEYIKMSSRKTITICQDIREVLHGCKTENLRERC